jgi:hypothetical protein
VFTAVVGRALTMRSMSDGDLGAMARAASRSNTSKATATTIAMPTAELQAGRKRAKQGLPELSVEDVPIKKFKISRRRECEVAKDARDAGWRGAGAA